MFTYVFESASSASSGGAVTVMTFTGARAGTVIVDVIGATLATGATQPRPQRPPPAQLPRQAAWSTLSLPVGTTAPARRASRHR